MGGGREEVLVDSGRPSFTSPAARRHQRAARLIVAAVIAALGLAACTFESPARPDETSPPTGAAVESTPPPRATVEPSPIPRHTDATSPPSADEAWGPGTPYLSVAGVPNAGARKWAELDRIGAFTVTRTGLVFLDPDSSDVIWAGWDHRHKTIGGSLQRIPGPPYVRDDGPLVDHRGIVGNPDLDIVAWIETAGRQWEDVVVVEASTGDELARASVPSSPDLSVRIASVDGGSIYFALLDSGSSNENGYGYVPGTDVWAWRWAAGEMPQPRTSGDQLVADVSAGIWAVVDGRALKFEDPTGRVLSQVDATHALDSQFGGGLSPDGRFWYSAPYVQVIETATGRRRNLAPRSTNHYGWTEAATVTFVGYQLSECSAITGQCSVPFDVPATKVCNEIRPCRVALPVN
jgi:hypothetical protein